jgi:hypothetical protein
MLRVIVYLLIIIIGGVLLPFTQPSSAAFGLVSGLMIGIFVPLLDIALSNSLYFRLAYYSIRYNRQHIRLSVSYLFRIKVDGAYLLVKSSRWGHFQPVGGVYKVSSGAKNAMDELNALDDGLVPIDEASLHDLRIRIPAVKLINFMRWFESGKSRETSSWREFYEELIRPGILSSQDFPFIFSNFIRREVRPIRFSSHAQSMEIIIADILELLPTPHQEAMLRGLKGAGSPDIVWATENQIRRLGAEPGKGQDIQIGEPAVWVL